MIECRRFARTSIKLIKSKKKKEKKETKIEKPTVLTYDQTQYYKNILQGITDLLCTKGKGINSLKVTRALIGRICCSRNRLGQRYGSITVAPSGYIYFFSEALQTFQFLFMI